MENRSRRRVLAAGLAGTALALNGRQASAGAPPSSPPSSPPGRPTPEDEERLAFAQRVELVARDLYQLALDEGAAGDEDRVLQACRDNHRAYADVISGLIGTSAPERRVNAPFDDVATTLLDERSDAFTTADLAAAASAGYDLESTLVATYVDMIAQLQGIDGVALVAAILIGESRMCAVLADLSGNGDDLTALLENQASPLAASSTAGG